MRRHGGDADSFRGRRLATAVSLTILLFPAVTRAGEVARADLVGGEFGRQVVFLVALAGVVSFAVWSALALMRARNRAETENVSLRNRVMDLKASGDRAEALLSREDQRLVIWGSPGEPAMMIGELPEHTGAPAERASFIAFGTWLDADSAGRLDRAVTHLRERGESFHISVATSQSHLLEATGSTVGGSAVVRFRDLTGDLLARAELEARFDTVSAEVEAMRAMLSGAPMPIWLRDETGRLLWVNAAYAAAVEAADEASAVVRGLELLDSAGRGMIAESRDGDPVFLERLPAIVRGTRRVFEVSDIASEAGSAGIAIDVTPIEAAEAALRREVDFNARTLDQLATAVAIFGADRRLRSYNAAYRTLFGLDTAFLDAMPEENAVLDRLRAARKLPEQADFRSWRADLFAVYRSAEARELWWHLPDGQTLRVIANPNPQGGMTWIYENVTARLDLESRYNALIHVQGETLDHLAEGVAVFGSNGRLRLHNPSFAAIWSLDEGLLSHTPHVTEIVAACRRRGDDDARWRRFTASVAGLDETRSSDAGRMDRPDGRVVDYATVPLPDGQTMVTFVDVTDSVQVERALVDRNEALEASAALKNAFIHHVSYELRSPLTNIIGFTELLADARVGGLNDRQREYVGYVMSSSGALLAIVNDILDLATVDAGIMELDLGEVDVGATADAAIEGLNDRAREARVRIEKEVAPDVGAFVADGKRIRQILFNLLANAIAYSPQGGRVGIAARRDGEAIVFTVTDQGAGIPAEFIDAVFDRFASRPRGSSRGGVGLGLSIVKSFVGLHGGAVTIQSDEGKGSTVTVRLPARPGIAAAAE